MESKTADKIIKYLESIYESAHTIRDFKEDIDLIDKEAMRVENLTIKALDKLFLHYRGIKDGK